MHAPSVGGGVLLKPWRSRLPSPKGGTLHTRVSLELDGTTACFINSSLGEDKNDLVEQGQRDPDLELPDQWSSLELPGGRLKHRHQGGGLSALAFESQSSKQDQAGTCCQPQCELHDNSSFIGPISNLVRTLTSSQSQPSWRSCIDSQRGPLQRLPTAKGLSQTLGFSQWVQAEGLILVSPTRDQWLQPLRPAGDRRPVASIYVSDLWCDL